MFLLSFLFAQDSFAKDNEIRIGACIGLNDCTVGVQLEYGRPEFTVGLHSSLMFNGIFAHYNFMNTGEELIRPILGLRAQYDLDICLYGGCSEDIFLTPYLGGEVHSRYITLRATVGPNFWADGTLAYNAIGATAAILGNIAF
tara:strand:+ start:288 stop:716 length:429 start_codon:yes stop_codon:yes gene_type:complete